MWHKRNWSKPAVTVLGQSYAQMPFWRFCHKAIVSGKGNYTMLIIEHAVVTSCYGANNA